MIIDETFMWLYWLYKVGQACGHLAAIFAFGSLLIAGTGCFLYFQPDLDISKKEIKAGKMMLKPLWFSVPAFILCLLVARLSPDRDELKAYAAYRIGERVVTSEEAKRMMDVALRYLEGGLVERQQEQN